MITFKSFLKLNLEQQRRTVALTLKKANAKIKTLEKKGILKYSPAATNLKKNIKKFNVQSKKSKFLYKQYKNLFNFNVAETSTLKGVGKVLQQGRELGVPADRLSYFWKVYHKYEEVYGVNFANFDSERAQRILSKTIKYNISIDRNIINFENALSEQGFFE